MCRNSVCRPACEHAVLCIKGLETQSYAVHKKQCQYIQCRERENINSVFQVIVWEILVLFSLVPSSFGVGGEFSMRPMRRNHLVPLGSGAVELLFSQ